MRDETSRRVFVAALIAAPAIGARAPALSAENASEIERLLRDLEEAHAERLSLDDHRRFNEGAYEANYCRHWDIRERIEACAARTLDDLAAKARAAQIALERDPDAECRGPGSFVSLSHSLAADVLWMSNRARTLG